jgi:glucose/arabinose dehydrogenase
MVIRRLPAHGIAMLLLGVLLGCGGSNGGDSGEDGEPPPTTPPGGLPVATFTAADGTRFGVQTLATGLQIPWSLAFTPDGRLFIAERPGRVRVFQNGALRTDPALTLADVFTDGESGILGMTVHPDFATNGLVYLTYTANGPRGPIARLMRFRELDNRFAEGIVLLDDVPAAGIHNGSRVRFGPDRRLYVTFGDVAVPSTAQDVASLNGKVLRLNEDGTSASGNPFNSPVYSYGHRNPQGIDWHPVTGDLWATEHGQTNNDEINVIERGRNYGWPIIEADQAGPDMVTPVTFYVPAVAPSGASFYRGTQIPAFRNQLFVATLRGMALLRITVDGRRITAQERLLENRYGRLRDVVSGPDGYLYVCTSNRDGRTSPVADDDRVLRIVPVN